MTHYTPTHPKGHRGPTFQSATEAALWITQQKAPSEWTWETSFPSQTTDPTKTDYFVRGIRCGDFSGCSQ